jgi:hypothetical protein
MYPVADRCFIHARINAIHSRLLTMEDYRRIIRAGGFDHLYPAAGSIGNETDAIRARGIVLRYHIAPLSRIMDISGLYSPLFNAFILLIELPNILALLRRAFGMDSPLLYWRDVSPHGILENSLRDSTISMDGLKDILRDSALAPALAYGDNPSCEELESRMEIHSLINLMNFSGALAGGDRRIFNELMALKTASMKIMLGLRLQRYDSGKNPFSMAALTETLPASGLTAEDIDEAERALAGEIARASGFHLFRDDPAMVNLPELERFLERLFVIRAGRFFFRDFHSAGSAISYAWLMHYQLRDLMAVIDGLHLKVPPDAIMKHLSAGT